MNGAAALYLVPYFLSCAISTAVGFNAWRHREENGAFAFGCIALAQASMTFGYVCELLSPTLAGKIFWDNVQFIGFAIWPVALLQFTLQYTGRRLSRSRMTWILTATPGILAVILAFTDAWHGLVYPNAMLIPGDPFPALVYDITATVGILFVWFLLVMAVTLALLGLKLAFPQRLYRAQVAIITVGTVVPLIGLTLTAIGIQITFHRDTSPFTYAISNLIMAWGLFRYRLFDVVPIAREMVLEHMKDALIVLDRQGRVLDLNAAACQLLGVQPQLVVGRLVTEVLGYLSRQLPPQMLFSTGQTEVMIQEGARPRTFEVTTLPLHSKRGRDLGRLLIWHDISERKQTEEEVRRYARKLEEANEHLRELTQVKDQFAANVSHELRTPITNLKLYQDLLVARPERSNIYLATLRRETERLETLIEDLLMLSRLEQDRITYYPRLVTLNHLLEEYINDRRALAEQKKLTILWQPLPDLPQARADPHLVGQVFSILFTNALNYTPAGGQVTVATMTSPQPEEQWVGFCVQDNGPGISLADQTHLFERFFRGEAGQNSGTPGTGLGLAIAHEIMTRHKGNIRVQSTGVPGEGTTFTVCLPAAANSNHVFAEKP